MRRKPGAAKALLVHFFPFCLFAEGSADDVDQLDYEYSKCRPSHLTACWIKMHIFGWEQPTQQGLTL